MVEEMTWAQLFPAGVCRDIVIDSDTGNETDDQYAIVWALLTPEAFRVRALYAAPFLHFRVATSGEGMHLSYLEIQRLLALCPEAAAIPVLQGATGFLHEVGAIANPAAEHLVNLSRGYSRRKPLYIIGIGALTNIAVALQLDPSLAERCELFWLGSQNYRRGPEEFNFSGDLAATRIVLESALPIRLFPCLEVAETLRIDLDTVRREVMPQGALGRFLANRFIRQTGGGEGAFTPMWDMAPFVALSNPEWVEMVSVKRRPIDFEKLLWGPETQEYWWMNESLQVEAIFREFFAKLASHHRRYPTLSEPRF